MKLLIILSLLVVFLLGIGIGQEIKIDTYEYSIDEGTARINELIGKNEGLKLYYNYEIWRIQRKSWRE